MTKLMPIFMTAAVLGIVLAGCAGQGDIKQAGNDQGGIGSPIQGQGRGPQGPGGFGNRSERPGFNSTRQGGNFTGNMTPEQRQAFEQQRLQAAQNACQGKTQGQACTSVNPRGNTTGTCQTQDGRLACSIPRPSRQPPFGGSRQGA